MKGSNHRLPPLLNQLPVDAISQKKLRLDIDEGRLLHTATTLNVLRESSHLAIIETRQQVGGQPRFVEVHFGWIGFSADRQLDHVSDYEVAATHSVSLTL